MKVAIDARYSSDNQRDASIADQLRVCRAYAERQGWAILRGVHGPRSVRCDGLIDAIFLTPNQGELQIELKGNLAAMFGAAQDAKRSPETGDLSLQVVMVAGGI